MNPVFVVNPRAANGQAAQMWPIIARRAEIRLGAIETRFTEAPGHASELAREAAAGGASMVVAVGGDGTLNEVVNGLMNPDGTPVSRTVRLGQICIGTGGDFRKTTGLPREHQGALDWLVGEKTRPLDVGRMEMTAHDGRTVVRYFANITSCGIGGEVDARVNRTTKAFGGFASFAWGALTAMLAYQNKPVHLILDDRDLGEIDVFNVVVANGQYFGGGMHVAPDADPADGLFDVIVLGDFGLAERLTQMPKIYNAGHLKNPKVQVYRARKVVAQSDAEVLLDVDGEAPGRLPTTFTICPGALNLKVLDR